MKKLTLLILTLFISVFLIGQEIQGMKTITISTGSANTLSLSSDVSLVYIVADDETLTSNFSIAAAAGTPIEGSVFEFRYYGKLDLNGNFFTIFGQTITQGQLGNAVFNKIIIYAHYFSGAWKVFVVESIDAQFWVQPKNLEPNSITTIKILDANVTLAKVENVTSGSIIIGSAGNIPTEVPMSGDIGIIASGATDIAAGAIVNADINGAAAVDYSKLNLTGSVLNADLAGSVAWDKMVPLTVSKVPVIDASGEIVASSITATELGNVAGVTSPLQPQIDGKITSGLASGKIFIGSGAGAAVAQTLTGDVTIAVTGVTTIPANSITSAQITTGTISYDKFDNNLVYEIVVLRLSFETSYQAEYRVRINYPCELVIADCTVIKTIAATDDATMLFQDNASNNMSGGILASGKLTLAASLAQGNKTSTNIVANNHFNAGEYLRITTAKATAGGEVIMTLILKRCATI